MSINDALNDDSLLLYMGIIFIIIMLIAIPKGIVISKKTNENIYGSENNGKTIEEKEVRVISRRSSPHPLNQTVMINSITFESVDGERMEFAIREPNVFGTIVEGDFGILKYRGNQFISFKRS